MKITLSELKQIIRQEVKRERLNESNGGEISITIPNKRWLDGSEEKKIENQIEQHVGQEGEEPITVKNEIMKNVGKTQGDIFLKTVFDGFDRGKSEKLSDLVNRELPDLEKEKLRFRNYETSGRNRNAQDIKRVKSQIDTLRQELEILKPLAKYRKTPIARIEGTTLILTQETKNAAEAIRNFIEANPNLF
jgi:hypothetical protein